jgi:hypothetical protein
LLLIAAGAFFLYLRNRERQFEDQLTLPLTAQEQKRLARLVKGPAS